MLQHSGEATLGELVGSYTWQAGGDNLSLFTCYKELKSD